MVGAVGNVVLAQALFRIPPAKFGSAVAWLRLASGLLDFAMFIPNVGLMLSIGSVLALFISNLRFGFILLQ